MPTFSDSIILIYVSLKLFPTERSRTAICQVSNHLLTELFSSLVPFHQIPSLTNKDSASEQPLTGHTSLDNKDRACRFTTIR